jgi:predicted nuclease with RNAse H fold
LGIDLAAQPRDTAACVIEWDGDQGQVLPVDEASSLDDGALLELVRDPSTTRVAIDAPFGWPLEFVEALVAYRDRTEWPIDDMRALWFRETDREVKRVTGQKALSVSTEWIVYPAMRCARLLSQLAAEGWDIDRSGIGRVLEVYPAAAMRQWGLDPRKYKGDDPPNVARRRELIEQLLAKVGTRLQVPARFVELCEADDDQFDALICALTSRAVELGRCDPIPEDLRWRAQREGWIHLPDREFLRDLAAA